MALVGVVALARAGLAYGAETAALRSAAAVKSQLRRRLVAHVTGPGADPRRSTPASWPRWPRAGSTRSTTTSRGYLPQLVLAVLVPIAVLVVVLDADWLSALIIALTLPLIPVFMALVGWQAQDHTAQAVAPAQPARRALPRRRRGPADAGDLPAGQGPGRADPADVARRTARRPCGTLRIAFLSALVLELLATLSVALVAVPDRDAGCSTAQLDLETALLVLILAPEAYLPLREVGARFHASMEGVAAAEQVFTVLDAARPRPARAGRVRRRARRPGGAAVRGRAPHPSRADRPALDGRRPGGPGRADARCSPGPAAPARRTLLSACCCGFADADRGPDHGRTGSTWRDLPVAGSGAADRVGAAAAVPVRRHAWPTTSGSARPTPTDAAVAAGRRARRGRRTSSRRCRDGYATRLGERGTGCRRASASGSPWPGRSCAG